MTYWLNGQYRDDPIGINVADRGFLLGDGIFETILLVDGIPAFWDEHIARLQKAISALQFNVDIDSSLAAAAKDLVLRQGAAKGWATLRIAVSRGAGPRGLAFPESENQQPTVLMTATPSPPPEQPAQLVVSAHIRPEGGLAARFKTANYLDNIMARQEAKAQGADEAVMLNQGGRVACASAANIFAITDGHAIITPPVEDGALAGIVRGQLLSAGQIDDAPIRQAHLDLAQLEKSELFITNSLIGVRAARLTNGSLSAGTVPSKRLRAVQAWYKKVLTADLEKRTDQF